MKKSLELSDQEFILVSGKPGSGKSWLLKYLLMTQHEDFSNNPIKYIVVFTTTKFNKSYESIIPSDYVHSEYRPEVLQSLLKVQSESVAKHRAAVIFDDCLPQAASSSQLFLNLCTTLDIITWWCFYRSNTYFVSLQL